MWNNKLQRARVPIFTRLHWGQVGLTCQAWVGVKQWTTLLGLLLDPRVVGSEHRQEVSGIALKPISCPQMKHNAKPVVDRLSTLHYYSQTWRQMHWGFTCWPRRKTSLWILSSETLRCTGGIEDFRTTSTLAALFRSLDLTSSTPRTWRRFPVHSIGYPDIMGILRGSTLVPGILLRGAHHWWQHPAERRAQSVLAADSSSSSFQSWQRWDSWFIYLFTQLEESSDSWFTPSSRRRADGHSWTPDPRKRESCGDVVLDGMSVTGMTGRSGNQRQQLKPKLPLLLQFFGAYFFY